MLKTFELKKWEKSFVYNWASFNLKKRAKKGLVFKVDEEMK